jgi:hypothetical protein
LSERQQRPESKNSNFIEGMRDIQGQYMMLADLYEKQRVYGQELAEIVKVLQHEADETIQLSADVFGNSTTAAYLVADAVIVMFDIHRRMTSKPLYSLPADVIVAVVQQCTSELGRMISAKRQAESVKVESLERVLRELNKAQATFRQTAATESRPPVESAPAAAPQPQPAPASILVKEATRVEQTRQRAPEARERVRVPEDAFAFRGTFGDKQEIAEVTG